VGGPAIRQSYQRMPPLASIGFHQHVDGRKRFDRLRLRPRGASAGSPHTQILLEQGGHSPPYLCQGDQSSQVWADRARRRLAQPYCHAVSRQPVRRWGNELFFKLEPSYDGRVTGDLGSPRLAPDPVYHRVHSVRAEPSRCPQQAVISRPLEPLVVISSPFMKFFPCDHIINK